MRLTSSVIASTAVALATAVHAQLLPPLESEAFQSTITTDGLLENLANLERIATENGGNRAFGLPGFDASRDFVFSRVSQSESFTATTQDFPALYNNVDSIAFRVGNTSYYVFGPTYSPSTSPEGLTRQLVLGPSGDAGCSVAGYAGLDVTDKMVLVQRGTCPTGGTIAGRVRPAAAAGAAIVILYNNVPTKVTGGTLSAPDPENFVPSGFINQVDGEALRERLLAGEVIEPYFQHTQTVETKITQNVFAESVSGDPNNVIMLGAHLDSVKAGAGINDDGSGSSLLLELFDGLQHFGFRNKIRLAWWGAEENGLVGSRYYTSQINNTEEANNLLLYLNFDMVSRGYFGVFDGDGNTHGLAGAPGSDVIEKLFVDHLTSKGINVTAAIFTGGSDYASFMSTLNKPVGGLHTGTGVAQDDCYHQQCDGFSNANPTTLTINARAAAHVLSVLAQRGQEIIPKNTGNSTMSITRRSVDSMDVDSFPWTTTLEGERHLGTCGHDI
ncbi:Vacuolar membrane protease [Sphaceloma murrayae]|uniref:Peptide hydrolase n=1 Tax=Sphaceloma murrayae TaxID=2082308 RepID=A0A2K1R1P0_9PEZI|nr:Vacuolar membrane protease [Sphaceloma murrayae]